MIHTKNGKVIYKDVMALKRGLKILGVMVAVMFSVGAVTFYLSDYWIEWVGQSEVNAAIHSKNQAKLKKLCADKRTFSKLKSLKHADVRFESDNQGSGKVLYYVVTIKQAGDFGLFFKTNMVLGLDSKLVKINTYQEEK